MNKQISNCPHHHEGHQCCVQDALSFPARTQAPKLIERPHRLPAPRQSHRSRCRWCRGTCLQCRNRKRIISRSGDSRGRRDRSMHAPVFRACGGEAFSTTQGETQTVVYSHAQRSTVHSTAQYSRVQNSTVLLCRTPCPMCIWKNLNDPFWTVVVASSVWECFVSFHLAMAVFVHWSRFDFVTVRQNHRSENNLSIIDQKKVLHITTTYI